MVLIEETMGQDMKGIHAGTPGRSVELVPENLLAPGNNFSL
jgi:hypothetical protein